MSRVILALALLLSACMPKPVAPAVAAQEPDRLPAPRIAATRVVPHPSPVVGKTSPAAVLRDSAAVHDEAFRYAAWPKAKTGNVLALVPLTAELARAMHAMQASRVHGRYGVTQTKALRAATDALDDFLQHKQD